MRSFSRGHWKAGFNSVRNAKMRSLWTCLGIIIGVASVISVVAIGQGIKEQIGGQIHHLGSNLITVQPAQLQTNSGSINNANILSGFSLSGLLSAQDIATVSKIPGLAASAPLTIAGNSAQGQNGIYRQGFIIGTTPDLAGLLNQSVSNGIFLNDDNSDSNVAVLGILAAQQMFNEDVPLGQSFSFHGQQFIVEGIFNQFDTTPLSPEADLNRAIFIPNQLAESLTNNTAPTYEILARPAKASQTAQVAQQIRQALNQSHGGQSDFSVLTGNQNLAVNNSILDLLTRLIAGVAAISLLVGGVGIMNVMLVSVTERMHEIGIRKAVGATNVQILSQFIIESTILGLIGGLAGIALAGLIVIGLRLATNLEPVISWQIVALASGVSFLIGVIFGAVPAIKAARKDPIEALRSE